MCGTTEFRLFPSSGAASGASTQLGFEVADIDEVVAKLRSRGLEFEPFDVAGFEVDGPVHERPTQGSEAERAEHDREAETGPARAGATLR